METNQSRNISNINFGGDVSQNNVYQASQGVKIGSETFTFMGEVKDHIEIEIDKEVVNLLRWLADQQGIGTELALKKAVATAAYIHDITARQGGKLLVQRKDNSVGEIVLK